MAILPIVTYNDDVLRKETEIVSENSDDLQALIDDMFETMYNSNGVGLAAPQVGKSLSLFVMNADVMTEELDDEENIGPMVFINPEITSLDGDHIKAEEGCLSIPDVRDDVLRPEKVTITYQDRDFNRQTKQFTGWISRVVQHEYDHLEGVLFVDYLSRFRQRMHRNLLKKIQKGDLKTEYPVVPKPAEVKK